MPWLFHLVPAHGQVPVHDSRKMNMDIVGGHRQLASSDNITSPDMDMELFLSWPSYFDHPEHSGLMFAHIAFMVLAWIVLLPIGELVFTSAAQSSH